MQMHPSMNIEKPQTSPPKWHLWPFLTDFDMWVRHVQGLFPVATIEFVAQTLCDCTSYPRYHPPKFQPNLNHHDEILILCYLPLGCYLLAKKGGCILDPIKTIGTEMVGEGTLGTLVKGAE